MGLEIKLVQVKAEITCGLCRFPIPVGQAYRIRWSVQTKTTKGPQIRGLIGYYHVEVCGPAMIQEIHEQEAIDRQQAKPEVPEAPEPPQDPVPPQDPR